MSSAIFINTLALHRAVANGDGRAKPQKAKFFWDL